MHKKRELSFASFDFLRFWTTLLIQIYARKTHAITWACINRAWISNFLKVSSFQKIKLGLLRFIWAHACAFCIMSLLFYVGKRRSNLTSWMGTGMGLKTFATAKVQQKNDIRKHVRHFCCFLSRINARCEDARGASECHRTAWASRKREWKRPAYNAGEIDEEGGWSCINARCGGKA